MKSQGLPINFIVIAALAILILVLIAAFVIVFRGSFAKALTPEVARSNCENSCRNLQTSAAGITWGTQPAGTNASSKLGSAAGYSTYCAEQDIQNLGTLTCEDFGIHCYVSFADGVQKKVDCP